jgi:hypothetical protein
VFVSPPRWIREEFLVELVEKQYEAYVLDDNRVLMPLVRKMGPMILMINIDGPNTDWEKLIRAIQARPEAEEVAIGVLSYDASRHTVERYVEELRVAGGYITLRQRIGDTKHALYRVFERLRARGRRKYVRARCGEETPATINITHEGKQFTGAIIDISVAGLACTFPREREPALVTNQRVPEAQLRLQGKIARVSGVVMGHRAGAQTVHVILFDMHSRNGTGEKIAGFIFAVLRTRFARTVKSLQAVG